VASHRQIKTPHRNDAGGEFDPATQTGPSTSCRPASAVVRLRGWPSGGR